MRGRPGEVEQEIGARIAARREKMGLTQSDLAGRLGISGSLLGYYEAGSATISVSRLLDLADHLEIPVASLLPRDPWGDGHGGPNLLAGDPAGERLLAVWAALSAAERRRLARRAAKLAEATSNASDN